LDLDFTVILARALISPTEPPWILFVDSTPFLVIDLRIASSGSRLDIPTFSATSLGKLPLWSIYGSSSSSPGLTAMIIWLLLLTKTSDCFNTACESP